MYVHDCIPVVLRHLEEEVVTDHTSVVDQNVQLSKMACRLIHSILYHSAIRYIAVKYQSFRAKAVNFGCYLLAPFGINVGERDTSALFSHAQRCRCSNASPSSCDKGNTSIESSHGSRSPFLQWKYDATLASSLSIVA